MNLHVRFKALTSLCIICIVLVYHSTWKVKVYFSTQYSFTDELQTRHAGVKAAIVKAHNADRLESVGDYNQALECYKDAVGLLIPMIEGTRLYLYRVSVMAL